MWQQVLQIAKIGCRRTLLWNKRGDVGTIARVFLFYISFRSPLELRRPRTPLRGDHQNLVVAKRLPLPEYKIYKYYAQNIKRNKIVEHYVMQMLAFAEENIRVHSFSIPAN